ncbi:MAG TPA: hypothetical protein VK843_16720, partial [Planctomycetota bacterium]|nr:hypothetical protein [Planctomycetota bacterium]
TALVLVFNAAPVYRWAAPALPKLEVNWIGVPLSLLDNLRMNQHLDQARVLERIDREVPSGATLYMLDVVYYRDAQQGVFERAGLIRADIRTRYVSSRSFQPEEREFFVYSARPANLEALGHVTRLEDYLFHVER